MAGWFLMIGCYGILKISEFPEADVVRCDSMYSLSASVSTSVLGVYFSNCTTGNLSKTSVNVSAVVSIIVSRSSYVKYSTLCYCIGYGNILFFLTFLQWNKIYL